MLNTPHHSITKILNITPRLFKYFSSLRNIQPEIPVYCNRSSVLPGFSAWTPICCLWTCVCPPERCAFLLCYSLITCAPTSNSVPVHFPCCQSTPSCFGGDQRKGRQFQLGLRWTPTFLSVCLFPVSFRFRELWCKQESIEGDSLEWIRSGPNFDRNQPWNAGYKRLFGVSGDFLLPGKPAKGEMLTLERI